MNNEQVFKINNYLNLNTGAKNIISGMIDRGTLFSFIDASLMSYVLGVLRGVRLYTAGYAKQSFLHSAVSAF